ncbi:MAG: ATP-binding protein [Armatimonadota bacterium]
MLREAKISSCVCASAEALCEEMRKGAGVAILAEEALHPEPVRCVVEELSRQPPWSDLPLVVFTRHGDSIEPILNRLGPLGNVVVLERPVRISTLVSAVRTALRARRRQYEVRDLLNQLEDADRRKDEFLAMLGHELRNPLSAIWNALKVLETVGGRDRAAVRQRAIIERQARHLGRLVDDLLDVSRVTKGKIVLQKQTVDLRTVAERCVQAHAQAAEAQRQQLELSLDEAPVLVHGDPVRLEQIVSNLLNNAIKYTRRPGVIRVSVRAEGSSALLSVADQGIGIPPDQLPHIFELFTQVERSLDRSQGGLGLGLPLVRSLAQLHGGSVEARSEGSDRGSEFIVRLPLSEATVLPPDRAQPAPNGTSPALPASGRCRVLLVEDNPDGRETLRDLLELWGYEVRLAEDGEEGLRMALADPPDIALLDIGLPKLDGYHLARELARRLDGTRPRMIAMTGYGQPEDRRRALSSGFDDHLVKPVDPDELRRVLEQLPRSSLPDSTSSAR